MPAIVDAQRARSDRARVRAHAALHVTISDAPLGVDCDGRDLHLLPQVDRNVQSIGGTRCRARHVGAHHARGGVHVQERRARGESGVTAERSYCMGGTDRRALAASRTRREKRGLAQRAGRSCILARRKLVRDRVYGVAERSAEAGGEERSAVNRVGHRIVNIPPHLPISAPRTAPRMAQPKIA